MLDYRMGLSYNGSQMKIKRKLFLIFELFLLALLPLAFLCILQGELLLDKSQYISLLKWHVLVIYACCFFGLIFSICVKLFQHPHS